MLLVLIDDAGFGNPSTFGGPIETPNYTRMAEGGLRYNRFHVTAVCSPTRSALLTGRNQHRVGFGLVARVLRPVPRLQRDHPARLRDAAADPAGERVHDRGARQVASDAGQPAGLERAVQPLADRARVRLLLGLPRRRGGPVRPADHREPEGDRRARGQGRQALLLPGRPVGEDDRLAPPRARGEARRRRGSSTTRPAAATRPTTFPGSGRTSTRESSTRAGTSCARETLARQKELGVVPPDAELPPRNDGFPTWDSLSETERRLYARQMETYAGYSENADWNVGPRPRRDRGDGRARQHARDLDLGRQRRQHGGHPLGHVQRDDDAERDPADARAADGPPLQARRPRGLGRRPHGPALLGGLGVGEQLPLRLGQAGRLPPRRHAQPARRPLSERDLRRRARCAATSRT